jgi:hypothetical protein
MSKHPYIRQVPTFCTYPGCRGVMTRDLDVKYKCVSCGRPYNWAQKIKEVK